LIQEALILLLIVLILWPKPVLGAARWLMRHAWGKPLEEEQDPPDVSTPGPT